MTCSSVKVDFLRKRATFHERTCHWDWRVPGVQGGVGCCREIGIVSLRSCEAHCCCEAVRLEIIPSRAGFVVQSVLSRHLKM